MLVEERHERAIGDEGRDAVGFIGREFERADPQEDDRDGDAHQRDADPIGMSDPGKRQTKIADHEFSSGVARAVFALYVPGRIADLAGSIVERGFTPSRARSPGCWVVIVVDTMVPIRSGTFDLQRRLVKLPAGRSPGCWLPQSTSSGCLSPRALATPAPYAGSARVQFSTCRCLMCSLASPIARAVFSNSTCCCAGVIFRNRLPGCSQWSSSTRWSQCAASPPIGIGGSAKSGWLSQSPALLGLKVSVPPRLPSVRILPSR